MGRTGWSIAVLTAMGAAVFYAAVGANIVGNAQRHDFLNLYTGATLAHAGDFARLHVPERQLEIERKLVPDLPALVPFVRPPVYAGLLAPLATLSLKRAFWVWVGIQIAILMVCWAWAAWRFGPSGLIWAALFLPVAYGIANGQDCALMLLLMIVAYELAEREKLAAAGFAIGLTLFKFHLLLLFPVLMIVSRRWRMLAGYCAAAGLEIGLSLLLGGWSGMVEYAKLLQRKDIERLSPSPEMMSNIHAIAANLGVTSNGVSMVLAGVVAAIAIYAAWRARHAGDSWRWFAAGIAGSLLMVPHVYGYDAAVLLLPVLLAIFKASGRGARYSAMAIALPCVFWLPAAGSPWAMGPALAISAFLIFVARERESDAFEPAAKAASGMVRVPA
jgi:Glycosyltransferase family 87